MFYFNYLSTAYESPYRESVKVFSNYDEAKQEFDSFKDYIKTESDVLEMIAGYNSPEGQVTFVQESYRKED